MNGRGRDKKERMGEVCEKWMGIGAGSMPQYSLQGCKKKIDQVSRAYITKGKPKLCNVHSEKETTRASMSISFKRIPLAFLFYLHSEESAFKLKWLLNIQTTLNINL